MTSMLSPRPLLLSGQQIDRRQDLYGIGTLERQGFRPGAGGQHDIVGTEVNDLLYRAALVQYDINRQLRHQPSQISQVAGDIQFECRFGAGQRFPPR